MCKDELFTTLVYKPYKLPIFIDFHFYEPLKVAEIAANISAANTSDFGSFWPKRGVVVVV